MVIYTLNLSDPDIHGVEMASENLDDIIKVINEYDYFNRSEDWELEIWNNGECIVGLYSNLGTLEEGHIGDRTLADEIIARLMLEKLVGGEQE